MRPRDVAGGLRAWEQFFGPSHWRGQVDRTTLPTPHEYLNERSLLSRRPRGEWALIRCPIHKHGAEAHPSMSISLVDRHFRCHACGAKGGDIIALHRLRTRLGFLAAVRDLGGRFHDD